MYPTQSNPSAPVQSSSPYNPAVKMEPPPYSSVVAQDSNDLRAQNAGASYPPAGGYQGYGAPAQAPYPPAMGNPPYPGGLGLGYGAPSQSPYPPGPQAPYPGAPMPMPMPGPVDTQRQIGFAGPVTMEPVSTGGFQPGGYGQTAAPNYTHYGQGHQDGMIYPAQQYNTNQYPQQQQPDTVYVVHKNEERSSAADNCCLWACCVAACCCFCECLKACISDD